MKRWLSHKWKLVKQRVFRDVYFEATRAALNSLEDDMVVIVEPKNLYDQGWNDAMKTLVRTINNYKRCGVAKC